jgi:hypothetical protein
MFGMSIRASDGARLLMGKTTLKSHWLDDGQHYQDGFYGVRDGSSHLVLPVEDAATINKFIECFGLQRRGESGLSVVVPWPYDDITSEQIVSAVLRGYFWPILTGQLQVIVEVPSMPEVWLDAANIISKTGEIGGELGRDLLPMLELADWARTLPEDERTLIASPQPTRGWQWSKDLIPEEAAKALQEDIEECRPIAVRVPVTVRPAEGSPQSSHFDIYAVRDPQVDRARPTFVREGIIVSRVNAPFARGLCALVMAEDPPVAAFLRDAENPSHTEWQHQGSNFRDTYVSGATDLRFVTRSVHEIIRVLSESEQEEDRTLLVDVFSLPTEQDGVQSGDVVDEDEDGGVSPEDTPPPPPAKPRAFRMDKVTGGFVVMASGVDDAPVPEALEVNVAYDTRRGNPLKRYNEADFQLGEPPIEIALSGLRLDECSGNRMVAMLTESDFRLEVTGFDANRDLYLRVTAKEANDANQTA